MYCLRKAGLPILRRQYYIPPKLNQLFTVHLQNCRFYAYHGLHAEEAKIGAEFEVSVQAEFITEGSVSSTHETEIYVEVYEIVKQHFNRPRPLLESLAQEIADDVHRLDARVHFVKVHITKLNPPIAGITGTVGVTYSKNFDS